MARWSSRTRSLCGAAADKMHNLYFVTLDKGCRGPVGAANDAAIDFDGQAFRRQAERFDQLGDRQAGGDLFRLSVQNDVHSRWGLGSADQMLQLAAPTVGLRFDDDGSSAGGKRGQR